MSPLVTRYHFHLAQTDIIKRCAIIFMNYSRLMGRQMARGTRATLHTLIGMSQNELNKWKTKHTAPWNLENPGSQTNLPLWGNIFCTNTPYIYFNIVILKAHHLSQGSNSDHVQMKMVWGVYKARPQSLCNTVIAQGLSNTTEWHILDHCVCERVWVPACVCYIYYMLTTVVCVKYYVVCEDSHSLRS